MEDSYIVTRSNVGNYGSKEGLNNGSKDKDFILIRRIIIFVVIVIFFLLFLLTKEKKGPNGDIRVRYQFVYMSVLSSRPQGTIKKQNFTVIFTYR